jgi:hypothetical protein
VAILLAGDIGGAKTDLAIRRYAPRSRASVDLANYALSFSLWSEGLSLGFVLACEALVELFCE